MRLLGVDGEGPSSEETALTQQTEVVVHQVSVVGG
jgi:hypothetical protein